MVSHPVNSVVVLSAIPADTISPVRPVGPVTPVADATQSDSSNFMLGQKYTAQIGERLANGLSLVNVAGKWLQMRMPDAFNSGDFLELTLIDQSPRLKFLLQTNTPTGSNPTTLSPTGKLLAHLLNPPNASTPKATNNTTPLLPSPPITTAEKVQLLSQLQQVLVISGLFYEAHLARWLKGNRSLQQLRQEPQGKLSATAAGTDSNSTLLIAPKTASLVQQQLHILETGTVSWRGEIWPGQVMEWDITEFPEHEQEKAESANKITQRSDIWQTCIHLHLPNLGKITATLMLDSQGIRIQLNADSDNTTQQFKREQVALATAMQTTGLTIQAMEIQRHETS